tara:strand:- start:8146 stop:8838 length:693 start_codon:yes stop_codon:yes gene_type:complete
MAIDYSTLAEELQKRGVTMDSLRDPGASFGYGEDTQYGQFFTPFDIEGYNESLQALQGLEESLMGGIERQFGFQGASARTTQQSNLQRIRNQQRPSGFISGAGQRLEAQARRAGAETYSDLVRQTEGRRTATEEQLGGQFARLTGLLDSFLGGTQQRALQIRQFDPAQTSENQGRMTTAQDIDSFMNRLEGDSRMGFEQQAMSLIGTPYQQLIDLFSQYQSGSQGGGMYG